MRANVGGVPGAGGTPVLLAFVGNPQFKNEELTAYELGYRLALSTNLSLDFATYYGGYDHLGTTEPAAPFFEAAHSAPSRPPVYLPEPHARGSAWTRDGGELEGYRSLDAKLWICLRANSHAPRCDQPGPSSVRQEQGSSPVHSAQLRSHLALSRGVGWDASLYFVDRLRSGAIPSYTRLDTGITWRWTEQLSMSVVGQNLVKDRHLEFVDENGTVRSTLIKRSIYGKLTWQF